MFTSKLINAAPFMGLLKTVRVLNICGGYGTGKTALGHFLAHEMLRTGQSRFFLSNSNSVWRDPVSSVQPEPGQRYLDVTVLLDEGGLFLLTGRDAQDYIAFTRKLNIVLLVPSVTEPTSKVQFMTCQRVFDFYAYGLPVWLYSWTLKDKQRKEKGNFWWWMPEGIYGIYDTDQIVDDDHGLSDYLRDVVNEYKRLDEQSEGKSPFRYRANSGSVLDASQSQAVTAGNAAVGREGQQAEQLPQMADDWRYFMSELDERLSGLGDAVSTLETAGRRGRKRGFLGRRQ